MNRKEAFAYLLDNPGSMLKNSLMAADWYITFGGLPMFGPAAAPAGSPQTVPDQIVIVTGVDSAGKIVSSPFTHWTDVDYTVYEKKVQVTGSQLGNALTTEGAKAGLSTTQVSSLSSGLKSALGL